MIKRLFISDKFILIIILLNALIIFFEAFDHSDEINLLLDIADNFFTILFTLELSIKVKSFGFKNYISNPWNIFDAILVIIAIPSLISLIVLHQFPDLNFLLALRILRIFKFFRFIRFIPQITKIINGAFKAAKASLIILVSFFIFNFTISLISCFLFKDLSPEFFKDPFISFYSIFKIFTIEGWYDIPDSIVANIQDSNLQVFFIRLYFIAVLFIGGIFGLSLVNSIFVDSMISDNNNELEEKVASLEKKIDKLLNKSNPI